MQFLAELRRRAAARRRRIVMPEAGDDRVLAAAAALQRDGIATPVLVLDPARPAQRGALDALGIESVDPSERTRALNTTGVLLARRSAKGLLAADAERLALDPLYAAAAMVASGEADGCVAGAVRTTADVLRSALWLIGPGVGVTTVSSAFYMVVPPFRGAGEEVLTFTDCAVVPSPTAAQLADIAVAAADDRRRVVGDEPRVALLSFSTRGSGFGPTVELVREAVALVRARRPDLAVDGELQG